MVIRKIKLVKVPQTSTKWLSTRIGSPYLPPLSLASITAYLRKGGFSVDQDDMNQKIHYNNYHSKNKLNLEVLSDPTSVIHYLKGRKDKELDKILRYMVRSTDLNGFDIYLVSMSVMRFDLKDAGITPKISGFHNLRSSNLSALLLCKYLKRVYKKPIVVGGDVNTELIALNSKLKLFEYAIIGPGEMAVDGLINALNKNTTLNNIKGLVYWKNNKVIRNDGTNQYSMIKPDFEGLPLKLYRWRPPKWLSGNIKGKKRFQDILILPVLFIEGCPHRCAYCSLSGNLNILKPSRVVHIIKELKEEYKTPYFMFMSNTFNISKKYVNDLCDEIINNELDIFWSDSLFPSDIDNKTLEKMQRAGCIRIVYGLETASPRLLDYAEKNIQLRKFEKLIKDTDSVGIWTHVNLIAGLPYETEKDTFLTLSFINKNRDYINDLHVASFSLFKGSKFISNPEKYQLANIRRSSPSRKIRGDPISKYSFDELEGRAWKEKSRQILELSEKMKYESGIDIDSFLEGFPLLFYLYSNIKDKNEIKRDRRNIIKRMNRIYIRDHPKDSIIRLSRINNIKHLSSRIKSII